MLAIPLGRNHRKKAFLNDLCTHRIPFIGSIHEHISLFFLSFKMIKEQQPFRRIVRIPA
jgi:hypothetical protein